MGIIVASVAFVAIVGALSFATRRNQTAGCCAPADPARDLRMRATYDDSSDTT